mmetsp:Transcript_45949/g.127531  ORF Transcript_45949/g.127531 Transcript_45949/m.127531 type:complete len:405 (+) Transcript_45949:148-1362(+)
MRGLWSCPLALLALSFGSHGVTPTNTDDEPAWRGPDVCWQQKDLTFERCCDEERHGVGGDVACWESQLVFSYATCCLEQYRPGPRCRAAATSEAQWGACSLPHSVWESQGCHQDSPARDRRIYGGKGVLTHYYSSYAEYVDQQHQRVAEDLRWSHTFAQRSDLELVATVVNYTLKRLGLSAPWRAVCHGSKRGAEVRWLSEAFAARGVELEAVGTDISPDAVADQVWEVQLMDYHDIDVNRVGAVDLIYSNALDHSPVPIAALAAWREHLTADGVLVLHTSWSDTPLHRSYSDPTVFWVSDSCKALDNGGFHVLDILRVPIPGDPDPSHHSNFIVAAPKPGLSLDHLAYLRNSIYHYMLWKEGFKEQYHHLFFSQRGRLSFEDFLAKHALALNYLDPNTFPLDA